MVRYLVRIFLVGFFVTNVVACPGVKNKLQSDSCRYSDKLSCVASDQKIEVTFSSYQKTETVQKCETTQQPSNATTVDFLMSASITAKVNDVVVDMDVRRKVPPGMIFKFHRAQKTYQYDEAQNEHQIMVDGSHVKIICVLYLVGEVQSTGSSGSGNSDDD